MTAMTRADDELLLGDWACLGILCAAPSHGFAISARLRPTGDVGRVWSLSRPLTYRSLDKLLERELIHAVGEEPGIAGGNRTILAPTRLGRAAFRRWVTTPVSHVRDLRSELLLKLVLAELCSIDVTAMLRLQRHQLHETVAALDQHVDAGHDVVALWRAEASAGALRFVERLLVTPAPSTGVARRARTSTPSARRTPRAPRRTPG
jgi:DNA-binding PadR family transcriptional regulator